MSLFPFIFGMISTLAISDYDKKNETEFETIARREVVAHAIDYAVTEATCDNQTRKNCKPIWGKSREELARHLITLAWHESNLSKNIHEDNCATFQCDLDKVKYYKTNQINHKAKSLWQIHAGFISVDKWLTIGGTSQEANNLAALTAAKMFSCHVNECKIRMSKIGSNKDPIEAGYTAYAGLKCEKPYKSAMNRVNFAKALYSKT